MRGLLRIASARAPFLRAGLAWPTATPIEVHITALDGERLLRLIREPVLTIQMMAEDGKFHALPDIDDAMTADQLQLLIDNFAADAPPVAVEPVSVDPAEIERLREVEEAWHADQRHLHDQGFQSLDALTSAWAADRAAIIGKTAELETAQADHAITLQRVADLEAKLVAATKPAPAAKAKAKAAE